MAEETKKYLDDHGLKTYHSHITNEFDFVKANLGENIFNKIWHNGWYFDQTGVLEEQNAWASTDKFTCYPGNTVSVAWFDDTIDKVIAIRVNLWRNDGTYAGFKYLDDFNSVVIPNDISQFALSVNKAGITATERTPDLSIVIDNGLILSLRREKANRKILVGRCVTEATNYLKEITLDNFDENNIQEGMEIVVWFKNANKANSPYLRINNNAKSDSVIGHALTADGGFIAYHNGDWTDGEIIHLVYMAGSNYHYWMMTNKGAASTTTYGAVKLSSTYSDKDSMTVLTGKALKSTIDELMTKENPTGTGSLSINRKENSDIGDYSTALGFNSSANGLFSAGEGKFVEASGPISHAEGEGSIASGKGAHAEGIGLTGGFTNYKDYFLVGTWTPSSYSKSISSIQLTNRYDQDLYVFKGDKIGFVHSSYGYLSKAVSVTQDTIIKPNESKVVYFETFVFSGSATPSYPSYNLYLENIQIAESKTIASGDGSHAEGISTQATSSGAHSEGRHTKSTSYGSHSEGDYTVASGSASHAEGSQSKAIGNHSHAEGYFTEAKETAHAEGSFTKAYGTYSHAEGHYTITETQYAHVQGKYNEEDIDKKYAHIVGNGTSESNRSNAHTLDWNGNAWYAGDVTGTDEEGNAISLRAVAKLAGAKNLWASNESYNASSAGGETYNTVRFSETLGSGDYTLSFLATKIDTAATAYIGGAQGVNQTIYFGKEYAATEIKTETKLSITTSALEGRDNILLILRNLKIRNIQLEKGSTSTIYVAPGISENLQKSIEDAVDSNTAVVGETLFIG